MQVLRVVKINLPKKSKLVENNIYKILIYECVLKLEDSICNECRKT